MKHEPHTFVLRAAASAVALCALAFAAEAEESVTTEAVRVTASRVERELLDVPMSVSVVTREDIERSGAQTIGDLLDLVPGVRINPDGGQGMKRAKIRGEDSFRTLVMIDGQKISEQKSMSGSPMLIDPSMVERIEVIKGPASVLYGSDAIGGAINIITKKGGEKPLQAEVSTGFNTSASGKTAAASIYGASGGWKYRLGVAYEDADNLETPKGEMNYTDFRSIGANLFVSYDIDADKTVGVTLDHFDMEFMSGNCENPAFFVDVPEWKRTKVGLFGEVRHVNAYLQRVRADFFYQQSTKSMHNHVFQNPGPMTIVVDPYADNDLDQIGFSLQTDWQLGERHYLIAGYEFNYDSLDAVSRTQSLIAAMGRPVSNTDKTGWYEGTMTTHALFAAMETQLPHDFTLSYGARYTYVDTDMDVAHGITRDLINDTVDTDGFGEPDDASDARLVFNAGILWSGVENLTLRATWSQGFRSPLLQERYVPTSMGQAGTTWNNPDLDPETSDNFELGARYAAGPLALDASVFYSLADDYIDALPSAAHNGEDMYQNVSEAKTYGLELTAEYTIPQTGWTPYAVATFMRRQFDYGNGVKTYDSGTPEASLRWGARWEGSYDALRLRADGFARTNSATDYRSSDGSSDYHLGGATTLNLTAGVDFGPQKAYSLDVGLYNITDKAYREQTSIWMPGRYFSVKLNAKF